jgi:hypothetical protein
MQGEDPPRLRVELSTELDFVASLQCWPAPTSDEASVIRVAEALGLGRVGESQS